MSRADERQRSREGSVTVTEKTLGFADIRCLYTRRRDERTAAASAVANKSRRLSNLRLVFFILSSAGIVVGLWSLTEPRPFWLLMGASSFVMFVGLVVLHRRVTTRYEHLCALAAVNAEALARLERNWDHLPVPRMTANKVTSHTADDLDLFGRASLFCLLAPVFTRAGKDCLARWLLEPEGAHEIVARQEALAELAPLLDIRQEMTVRGRGLGDDPPETEGFLGWVRTEPWLLKRRGLIWITRALPVLCLGLLVAHVVKVIAYPVWFLPLVINIALTRAMGERIHATFSKASLGEQAFHHYSGLFAILEGISAETEKLRALKEATTQDGLSAHQHLRRLNQVIHMADVRHSSMLHTVVQVLLLWDFHILFLLERWQRDIGVCADRWMTALGEFEALTSMASLYHDHPAWVFPTITTGEDPKITASGLGHPLLHPEVCVVNDVELGPPGTFLLITGSNMSGKSTLLRAIGVNVTLALAGGPVCAQSMRLPRVVLGTSFRVRDSIEDGVSYFMAELQQLKDVIDRARTGSRETDCLLLYLLDEVLLGTNVRERHIAVQRVIRYLLEQNTLGAVATHDLSLADAPVLSKRSRTAYFSERFVDGSNGPEMTFDYVLRPGLSTTTNALKLLQLVGIADDGPDD